MVELTQEQLQMVIEFQQKQQEIQRFNNFKAELDAIEDELYNVAIAPHYTKLKQDRLEAEVRGATLEELKALTAAHDAIIAPIHAEYDARKRACSERWGYS